MLPSSALSATQRRSGPRRSLALGLAVAVGSTWLVANPLAALAIGRFDVSNVIVTTTHVQFNVANLDRSNDGDNGGYNGVVIWAAISCFDAADSADGVDGDGFWMVTPTVSDGSTQYNAGDLVSFTPGISTYHPRLWDGTPYSNCVARVYSNAGQNDYQSLQSFSIPTSASPPPPSLLMGPQAMEGDLRVAMGQTIKAGYDFTIPGRHVSQTIGFSGAHVDFPYTCVTGPATPSGVTPAGSGTLSVIIPARRYPYPANKSPWLPSDHQSDPAAFQGAAVIPTNSCTDNGLVRLQRGGSFSFALNSNGKGEKINVRWHYSANGSAGGWSGTKGFVPSSAPPPTPGGEWIEQPTMPTSRREAGAAADATGVVFVVGGYNGTFLNNVEAYDASTGMWTIKPPMPVRRNEMVFVFDPATALFYMGGGFMSGGGVSGRFNDFYSYDPGANVWSTRADMPEPVFGAGSAVGVDGRVYVFGGSPPEYCTGAAHVYDPFSDAWSTIAAMSLPTCATSAVLGPDGKIYVVGGHDGAVARATVASYDPVTDSWTNVADLPTARSSIAVSITTGGKILAVGGLPTGCICPSNEVDEFDIATNSWTVLNPYPLHVFEVAAAGANDGNVHVFGGWTDVNESTNQTFALAQ